MKTKEQVIKENKELKKFIKELAKHIKKERKLNSDFIDYTKRVMKFLK